MTDFPSRNAGAYWDDDLHAYIDENDAQAVADAAAAALTVEAVRDIIGATLVGGSNVSIAVNDTANTVTLSATGSTGGSGTLDIEGVRDTIGATLVGGQNVNVVVDDAGDTVTISADLSGISSLYRGEWAADSLAYQTTLTSNALPGELIGFQGGYGVAPVAANVSGSGISGTPGGETRYVALEATGLDPAGFSRVTLAIQALGLANVTRVTARVGTVSLSQGISYFTLRSLKNGSLFATIVNGASYGAQPLAWTPVEIPATATDTIGFEYKSEYPANYDGYPVRAGVAEIRVYTAADPYMTNQVVSYQGKLWRSTANYNNSTPGTGSTWVEVLTASATDPDMVRSTTIDNIVTLTQAAYTALAAKAATTLYVIVG